MQENFKNISMQKGDCKLLIQILTDHTIVTDKAKDFEPKRFASSCNISCIRFHVTYIFVMFCCSIFFIFSLELLSYLGAIMNGPHSVIQFIIHIFLEYLFGKGFSRRCTNA